MCVPLERSDLYVGFGSPTRWRVRSGGCHGAGALSGVRRDKEGPQKGCRKPRATKKSSLKSSLQGKGCGDWGWGRLETGGVTMSSSVPLEAS